MKQKTSTRRIKKNKKNFINKTRRFEILKKYKNYFNKKRQSNANQKKHNKKMNINE